MIYEEYSIEEIIPWDMFQPDPKGLIMRIFQASFTK